MHCIKTNSKEKQRKHAKRENGIKMRCEWGRWNGFCIKTSYNIHSCCMHATWFSSAVSVSFERRKTRTIAAVPLFYLFVCKKRSFYSVTFFQLLFFECTLHKHKWKRRKDLHFVYTIFCASLDISNAFHYFYFLRLLRYIYEINLKFMLSISNVLHSRSTIHMDQLSIAGECRISFESRLTKIANKRIDYMWAKLCSTHYFRCFPIIFFSPNALERNSFLFFASFVNFGQFQSMIRQKPAFEYPVFKKSNFHYTKLLIECGVIDDLRGFSLAKGHIQKKREKWGSWKMGWFEAMISRYWMLVFIADCESAQSALSAAHTLAIQWDFFQAFLFFLLVIYFNLIAPIKWLCVSLWHIQ